MDKFTTLTGVAAPMPIINVDTDMIIPKDYLKTIARTGLGKGLFSDMRYNEDGSNIRIIDESQFLAMLDDGEPQQSLFGSTEDR